MNKRHTASHQTLGAKLGPRLAIMVNKAITDHLRQSANLRAKIASEGQVEFWKTVSRERDAHWGPMLERLLAHDDHPDWMKQATHFIRHGHGEGAAMAALSVAQGVASQSIFQVLNAELAPIIHSELAKLGTFLLDPSTSAAMAAHGIITVEQAAREAAGSGYKAQRAEWLIEAATTYPDLTTATELFRRKKINREQFVYWMKRGGIPSDVAQQLFELWQIPLQPDELALMVLKGIRTEEEVAAEAQNSGVTRERLHRLVLAAGEPISLQELQQAYRRGFIDKARLEHGVKQSRVRNEWVDVILELRYEPASVADAIKGAVQNHISLDKAKHIAQQNGLEPGEVDWLYETAGNPPGVMQMIDLWRRGKMTEDQVKQGIRESRVKNKYVDHLVNLKRVLPQQRQIVGFITRGAMSEKEGSRLLLEHGYDPGVVKAMIKAATTSQVVRERNLAAAQIQELYYDHAITVEEAHKLLKRMGYTEPNAKLLLRITELRREKSLRQAAMGPIRTQYVGRHIDKREASLALDGIGIPHQQRDFALTLWTHDREASRKMLTEAQIVKANTMGLLKDDAAEERLQAIGYTHADARLLLNMEKGRTTPAP